MLDLTYRPRRLRRTPALRSMVQEHHLRIQDLIYPLFVMEGVGQKVEVSSMPGAYRYTPDQLLKEVETAAQLGIPAIALFLQSRMTKKIPLAKRVLTPTD